MLPSLHRSCLMYITVSWILYLEKKREIERKSHCFDVKGLKSVHLCPFVPFFPTGFFLAGALFWVLFLLGAAAGGRKLDLMSWS